MIPPDFSKLSVSHRQMCVISILSRNTPENNMRNRRIFSTFCPILLSPCRFFVCFRQMQPKSRKKSPLGAGEHEVFHPRLPVHPIHTRVLQNGTPQPDVRKTVKPTYAWIIGRFFTVCIDKVKTIPFLTGISYSCAPQTPQKGSTGETPRKGLRPVSFSIRQCTVASELL